MKTDTRVMRVIRSPIGWLALGAVLLLFPFDWLSEVWPAFGYIFDQIFVSAREHAIGHTTLFLLVGLLVLCALPGLRRRPLLYALIMILAALGEECLQAISKWQMPNLGDGRDIGFDTLGFMLAYLLVWAWLRLRDARSDTKEKTGQAMR